MAKQHRQALKKLNDFLNEGAKEPNLYISDDCLTLKLHKLLYKVPPTSKLVGLLQDTTSRHIYTMGARGSGKSVANLMKTVIVSSKMPKCHDGIRRARWVFVRTTYAELLSTTFYTFKMWLGHSEFNYSKTDKPYLKASITLVDKDGKINIEYIFIPFNSEDDLEKARSLEVTGAVFNEASFINRLIVDELDGSSGRYPPQSTVVDASKIRRLMLYDSNAIDEKHWLYVKFVENENGKVDYPDHKFIHQEGGLIETDDGKFIANPNADNLENLEKDYYINKVEGKTRDFIRMSYCNQFASYNPNAPVFPEFNNSYTSDKLDFDKTKPIFLSFDFGGVNACLFGQYLDDTVRIFKEMQGIRKGLTSFLLEDVLPYVRKELDSPDLLFCIGDCSNAYSFETAKKALEIVKECLSINCRPAITNKIYSRIQAVDYFIANSNIGHKRLQINTRNCPCLSDGMLGKYQYRVVKTSYGNITDTTPLKNEYSHLADCLQYACLEIKKYHLTEETTTSSFVNAMPY